MAIQVRLRFWCLALPLLLIVLVAPTARAQVGDTLTVEQCVNLARERSPEARSAAADQSAARFDSSAASHQNRPAYSLFGGATIAPRHFYDPAVTNLGQYTAKVGAAWTWFDGGAQDRDADRAALGARRAAVARVVTERDAALAAGALALTNARLGEAQQAQGAAVSWLERLASEMTAGVRGGAYGQSDALRVTLERDAAATALRASQREAQSAARELARWIGREAGAAFGVKPPERPAAAPSLQDSLRVVAAFTRGGEGALSQLDEAAARIELEGAERKNAWHVDLAADAGLAGTDLTRAVPDDLRAEKANATFADRLRRDLGASATITFTAPLADITQPLSVVARRASLDAARLRRDDALTRQRQGADELLARWRAAALEHDAVSASMHRAEEHLLRLRSLYAAGATTLLELLDARRLYDDARGQEADARYQVLQARLESEVR